MRFSIFFILALTALTRFANGQAAITATTVPRSDGSYTDTVVDPDQHRMTLTDYTLGLDRLKKNIKRTIIYKLDDQAQPIAGFAYNAKGKLTLKSIYKRDAMNRIEEEDDYSPNDILLCKITYQFDANGNITGMQAVDSQGNPIAVPATRYSPHSR